MQDGGETLVIDPDTAPFELGMSGCGFVSYAGTFVTVLTVPSPTPTP